MTDPSRRDTFAFLWNVTSNNGQAIANGTSPNFSFTPDDNGTYAVSLTVTDDDGGASFDHAVITATNVTPQVNAGVDQTVTEGSRVNLAATLTDPGSRDTFTARWHVVASNGQVISDATTPAFSFTPVDNGRYSVTLTVQDDEGATASDQLIVTVLNAAPAITTTSAGATVEVGQPASLTGSFVDPGADTWRVTVDFKDGTVLPLVASPNQTFQASHVFTQPGTYRALVVVSDNDLVNGPASRAELVFTVNEFDLFRLWQDLLQPANQRDLSRDLNADGQISIDDLELIRNHYRTISLASIFGDRAKTNLNP